ncbi:MAG: hypothetical protein HQL08_09765, partial [Nitrospirae bacterium]|nr:hypothetical protein [Nitrospirota bacterium]
MMSKVLCFICLIAFIFGASASSVDAGVNIDIGIALPPPVQFTAQPELIVVPSGAGYVYMVPDMAGMYFFRGVWYRHYKGAWFRASVYNGEWLAVAAATVPVLIMNVPPDYPLYLPQDYYRIQYHDALVRWREWERIRHWNHYEWYKHELNADVMQDRRRAIERGELPPRGPEQPHQRLQGQP